MEEIDCDYVVKVNLDFNGELVSRFCVLSDK